jgi:hypothetical protein
MEKEKEYPEITKEVIREKFLKIESYFFGLEDDIRILFYITVALLIIIF